MESAARLIAARPSIKAFSLSEFLQAFRYVLSFKRKSFTIGLYCSYMALTDGFGVWLLSTVMIKEDGWL